MTENIKPIKYCNVVLNQTCKVEQQSSLPHFQSTRLVVDGYYRGEKTYKYKTTLTNLKPGDLVVVPVRNGNNPPTFKVGVFIDYDPLMYGGQKKQEVLFIVDKVDTTSYYERIDKDLRRKEILEELRQRKQQMEEIIIFKMLAEQDTEAKQLLQELEDLK